MKKELAAGQLSERQKMRQIRREARADKSRHRQVHRHRGPCSLKRELAEGQLSKTQERLEMTREE